MLHIWCLFCCFHSFGRLAVSSFSHTGRSLPIYRLCHGFSFSLLHYGRISYPSLHLSLIRTNVFSFTLYLHLSFSRLLVVCGFLFAGMLIIIIIITNNAARPLESKHSLTHTAIHLTYFQKHFHDFIVMTTSYSHKHSCLESFGLLSVLLIVIAVIYEDTAINQGPNS